MFAACEVKKMSIAGQGTESEPCIYTYIKGTLLDRKVLTGNVNVS
jgi:hypothetical protein